MNQTISILAYAFYVVVIVLAVPGLAYLLFEAWRRIRERWWPSPRVSSVVPNADGLLQLFNGIYRGLDAVAKVGGFVGQIVAGILTGIALSAVLVATLLFFTARGLLDQQPWARWVAGILMTNLLLLAALSLLSSGTKRGKRSLIALLVAVLSGLAIHALWKGYG